jgi:beta-glucosidase
MRYTTRNSNAWLRSLIVAALFGQFAVGETLPPKPFSSFDPQAKALVSRMTLDEKIGQMTQPEMSELGDLTDIARYFVGSVLSGGNSDPADGNSVQAWSDTYDRCQQQALSTRLKIPLLYGVDAVHEHNNVSGAVIFPHNVGLGCTRDAALVEKIARITAEEVRATGINWAFAPCVAVPRDIRWGRTYEGFSEDPEIVTLLGAAAVRGLQRRNLHDPLAVLACGKHFVGDGGTAFGSSEAEKNFLDQGDTRLAEITLRHIHVKPYETAIAAGVGTIMPSFSSWNGVKCSANKYLLTDVLKGELGFEGFLISDYNAVDQVAENYKDAIELSVNAGMDMVMVPSNYKNFCNNLRELVNEGRVSMSRIDDAVTRILRVKFAMGLFDESRSLLADPRLQGTVGSNDNREVARDAVRKSLVLLKNERNTLPLSKNLERIHVAGHSADDIGRQCGGWTIDWQGKDGDIVPGTTVLEAVRSAVSADTEVTFSTDGAGAEGASLAIVVIGEAPYAEGQGDSSQLALPPEDLQTIENITDKQIPVVAVLLSGRPLIINEVLDRVDAFVAAWLPGSEGQGVTDVLFGDYAPTGRLSYTWPDSLDDLPAENGNTQNQVRFRLGDGLTFDK